jgi:hypothetical protein
MAGCSRAISILACMVLIAACGSALPVPTGSVLAPVPTPTRSTRPTPPTQSPIAHAVLTASATGSCEDHNAALCWPVLVLEPGHISKLNDWEPSDDDYELASTGGYPVNEFSGETKTYHPIAPGHWAVGLGIAYGSDTEEVPSGSIPCKWEFDVPPSATSVAFTVAYGAPCLINVELNGSGDLFPDADAQGELFATHIIGCGLAIRSGSSSFEVVWPDGYLVDPNGAPIELVNTDGVTIAAEGDLVALRGEIRRRRASYCTDRRTFVATEIVAVIEANPGPVID